jgi:tRNA(Ile)-lysidine synthase
MAGTSRPALGVAVSGGGDSLALMHLLGSFARRGRLPASRPDGGSWPAQISARMRKRWRLGPKRWLARSADLARQKPKTGIEAAARKRATADGRLAAKNKIATLFVGHNQDDQAETFLLRLAGAAVWTALPACAARALAGAGFAALVLARPLLGSAAITCAPICKPGSGLAGRSMNEDTAFDRVKIRKEPALDARDLPWRIAAAARHLARARESLE